jgi:lipoprotein-anchoring transpeptidase ErfK/SrfK
MRSGSKGHTWLAVLAAGAIAAGCGGEDRDVEPADTIPAGGATATGAPPATDTLPAAGTPSGSNAAQMRLEVNLAARELYVYRDGEQVATHPVAVGSSEWPTPTGEWTVGEVVWNPRWIPPDEAWAEDEEEVEPGDPDNPLGRAQLVYRAPNSIHGTNDPESLGQAVSHGSIRVSNEVAQQLAREVMEAGGAARDEAFYQRVRNNRTERVAVDIPNPVPIRVVEGG